MDHMYHTQARVMFNSTIKFLNVTGLLIKETLFIKKIR